MVHLYPAARAEAKNRRRREAQRAKREADRLEGIHINRAERIKRIQDHHYPAFLAKYPVSYLPIPPLVVGSRMLWDRAYRTWRDAVLLAVDCSVYEV